MRSKRIKEQSRHRKNEVSRQAKPIVNGRDKTSKRRMKKKQYSKAYLQKRFQRNLILAGMLALCVLILLGISSLYFWQYVKKYDNGLIAKGVYVSDISAGGMDKKEAEQALLEQEKTYTKGKVTATLGDKSAESTLTELGFSAGDRESIVKKAMNYGKTGNIWKRYLDIRKLKKGKKVFQPTYSVDADKIDTFIAEQCEEMQSRATDATLSVSGDDVSITDEAEGIVVDNQAFITKLKSVLNSNWHGEDVKVEFSTTTEEPQVTKKDLKGITDVLGSFSTDVGGSTNRKKNVENSANQVNGTLLMPGEEVSVNEQTLPHTEENGYFEAPSYENGEIVQSISGGICQMCTTVYNAVLNAELKVTQRQPHSMIVSYVEPSRDAAIAGDYKDLKFVNNTDSPIYVYCNYENDVLTARIYGKETRPENRTIEFKSVTNETKEPGDSKFVANTDEAIGSYYVSTGAHKGVEAELWKYIYVDGAEESKEQVNSSSYKASGATVSVGVKSSNAEAVGIVKTAIASQNKDTIQAAIAKAKALEQGSTSNGSDSNGNE